MTFSFPKILHLYWDLSTFSYLNFLTVESFNKYHDNWDIRIHYPKKKMTILLGTLLNKN